MLHYSANSGGEPNERSKLAEARYFYSRMRKEVDDREAFTCNLSAFLAAARSVLQYALKEAKTKTGGQNGMTIRWLRVLFCPSLEISVTSTFTSSL